MRHAVDAGKDDRMPGGQGPRVRPESRYGHPSGGKLIVGHAIGKHAGVRHAPVHVDRVKSVARLDAFEVVLRGGQFAGRFHGLRVAGAFERTDQAAHVFAAHEEVGIAPRPQMRARVMRVRERRTLDQQARHARRRQAAQHAPQLVLADALDGRRIDRRLPRLRDRVGRPYIRAAGPLSDVDEKQVDAFGLRALPERIVGIVGARWEYRGLAAERPCKLQPTAIDRRAFSAAHA